MKFSVCIDAVYSKKPLKEALDGVCAAGYDTVEFWSWKNKDLDLLAAYQAEKGLSVAGLCTGCFNLTDPAYRGAYLDALRETLPVAQRLRCPQIITQVGKCFASERAKDRQSIVDGLRLCAPVLENAGAVLLIEPLNIRVDHPGYFLTSSDECAEILDEVGSPNVKMLFDIYHQQITEGDVIRHIRRHIDHIGHFHAAGNPGRHEPDSGELNYRAIFDAIAETGYKGYVGLEYFPAAEAQSGLNRLHTLTGIG